MGEKKKKVTAVMLKRTRISSMFSPKKDTVVEKEPVDRGCFGVFFYFFIFKFTPAVTFSTQRLGFTPQLRPSLRETILVQGDADKSLISDPSRDRIRNWFLQPATHCAAVPLLSVPLEAAARRLRLHYRSGCPNPICCPCSNILLGAVTPAFKSDSVLMPAFTPE